MWFGLIVPQKNTIAKETVEIFRKQQTREKILGITDNNKFLKNFVKKETKRLKQILTNRRLSTKNINPEKLTKLLQKSTQAYKKFIDSKTMPPPPPRPPGVLKRNNALPLRGKKRKTTEKN